jgi:DNA-binding MarR family transcriptional regulator
MLVSNLGLPVRRTDMSDTAKKNGIPDRLRTAFPLRLGEQLWAAHFHMFLDVTDKWVYRTAMKHVDPVSEQGVAEPIPLESGATLFTFLDVADRLYERLAMALARVGLSYAKYEVLKHLRDAPEPVTLGALAEGQRCARSNITQLIDRLESEGLVRRVDDPVDRRAIRAELTEEGSVLLEEGATQIDLVRAEFAASFTARERQELGRLLGKIR